MAGIREGRWDCQYCGTVGVLGRHKTCPVCASPRPAGVKFYLPQDAGEVNDVEALGYAKLGPDWVCAFCGTSNGANLTKCRSCQADKDKDAVQQQVKEYKPGQAPKSGDMDMSTPPPRPAAKSQSSNNTLMAVLGVAFLLLVCFCCVIPTFTSWFGSDEITVTIQQYEWSREVDIEEYKTVTESDWSVPAGGRTLSQQEEIFDYEQIVVGYETKTREVSEEVRTGSRDYVCGQRDLGNGFFEDVTCTEDVYETRWRTETYEEPIHESKPIYKTKYTYEIEKWVPLNTEKAAGQTREASWPTIDLGDDKREGEKRELYAIIFVDGEGQTYRLEFPYERWRNFEPDGEYILETSFGEATGIKE